MTILLLQLVLPTGGAVAATKTQSRNTTPNPTASAALSPTSPALLHGLTRKIKEPQEQSLAALIGISEISVMENVANLSIVSPPTRPWPMSLSAS